MRNRCLLIVKLYLMNVFGLEEEKIENPFEVHRCDAQVKGALEFLDDAV